MASLLSLVFVILCSATPTAALRGDILEGESSNQAGHTVIDNKLSEDSLVEALVEEHDTAGLALGGAEEYTNFPQASENAKKFVAPFAELAFATPEARTQEWKQVDYNGNNLVSLAELDSYVERKLKNVYKDKGAALLLWKAFRPSYIRAFNDAKDISPNTNIRGTKLQDDDYITFSEFRYTCHYLCIYSLMYDVFAYVDGKGYKGEVGEFAGPQLGKIKGDEWDDRRIDMKEWKAMYKTAKVSGSGFKGLQGITDPEAVFGQMDSDGHGKVLLKEWCEYLEKKEEEAGTAIGQRLKAGETD